MTTKKDVLEAAIKTVADRGVPYGGVENNFRNIANMWNVHVATPHGPQALPLAAADVAMMMVEMKLARLQGQPRHPDSWIDICGYGACGAEVTADAPDATERAANEAAAAVAKAAAEHTERERAQRRADAQRLADAQRNTRAFSLD